MKLLFLGYPSLQNTMSLFQRNDHLWSPSVGRPNYMESMTSQQQSIKIPSVRYSVAHLVHVTKYTCSKSVQPSYYWKWKGAPTVGHAMCRSCEKSQVAKETIIQYESLTSILWRQGHTYICVYYMFQDRIPPIYVSRYIEKRQWYYYVDSLWLNPFTSTWNSSFPSSP